MIYIKLNYYFLLFKEAGVGRFMTHKYDQWASDLIESGRSSS